MTYETAVPEPWFVYPIEIRPGVVVRVHAPRDLTKAEAEKVGRVMLALGDGEATITSKEKP